MEKGKIVSIYSWYRPSRDPNNISFTISFLSFSSSTMEKGGNVIRVTRETCAQSSNHYNPFSRPAISPRNHPAERRDRNSHYRNGKFQPLRAEFEQYRKNIFGLIIDRGEHSVHSVFKRWEDIEKKKEKKKISNESPSFPGSPPPSSDVNRFFKVLKRRTR